MPIWAYIYCVLIVIAGVGAIYLNRKKPWYYMPGEILSVLFSISFFLFYYEVVSRPSFMIIPVLLLVYILFWELWVNRHHYALVAQFGEETKTLSPAEIKRFKRMQVILMTMVLSPLLYVMAMLFYAYVA